MTVLTKQIWTRVTIGLHDRAAQVAEWDTRDGDGKRQLLADVMRDALVYYVTRREREERKRVARVVNE